MKNLKILREHSKLSQQDVASVLNITKQAYSYYEKDKRNISTDQLVVLANYYKSSVDLLLGRGLFSNLDILLTHYDVIKSLIQNLTFTSSFKAFLSDKSPLEFLNIATMFIKSITINEDESTINIAWLF